MTLEESQELNKRLIEVGNMWRRYCSEVKREYLAELYPNASQETFARISREVLGGCSVC